MTTNPLRTMRCFPFFLTAGLLVISLSDSFAEGEGGTEFARLLASYGEINTIAGLGIADDCDGWVGAMEGGAGTGAELSRPHMAQADALGNVYIADKEGHAIRKVRPDGIMETVAGNGSRGDGGEGLGHTISLREPNGLFTFPDGTTFILEIDDDCEADLATPGGKIRRLGADGMMTTVFTDNELVGGRGLWVSPDESLIYYCSFDVVRKWTAEGGIETFASGFGTGSQGLGNMDVDPMTGLVCVTDRGQNRVFRLSADGLTSTVIAGNGSDGNGSNGQPATNVALDQVRGIAFRPDGSFFVCTHKGDHAVWFVDTAGLIWKFIDGQNNAHSGDGSQVSTLPLNVISEPRAVTIAPNGDILITEKDEGHIRRITNICVEPEIVEFDPTSGNLTWTSHREGDYWIEESRDLKTWTPMLGIETSEGPTTSAVVNRGFPSVFFRVVGD